MTSFSHMRLSSTFLSPVRKLTSYIRQEIRDATAIPDPELQRHLQSLACAKFKVLKKHPPSRDVHPSDSFSFNVDFSAPLQKIKISTVAARVEDMDERKETKDRVDEERRHQMDVSAGMDGRI
jgi:cullin 3